MHNLLKKKFLLMLLLLLCNLPAVAQTVRGRYHNTPLKTVLEEVEQQTGYSFIYEISDISGKTVTATFQDTPLKTALKTILGPSFRYTINGKLISLSHREVLSANQSNMGEVPAQAGPQIPPDVTVQGVVSDDIGPVAGVAIIPDGKTGAGVITDIEGRFSITVPRGTTLKISSIGYNEVSISAEENRSLRIALQESTQQLQESIVVGYGIQAKESVVGAISQISTEAVVDAGSTNITHAIAGKLSGVLTMQSSGTPGANDAEIMVRGISSWNGSSPLVMVDGVERSFSDLDPNEIASISVLKDASATAVFGAKGANGVILVTTRTGNGSKPKLSLSVSHGFNFAARLPEHVSAYETAVAYNVAMKNSNSFSELYSDYDLSQYKKPSTKLNAIRYPDNNWYDLVMRDVAQTTDANINVTGGNNRVNYFISFGYKNEGSIFKSSPFMEKSEFRYDRINYRANLDFNFTPTTQLSYKVGGNLGIRVAPKNSPISVMYAASTISYPAYYPAWVLEEIPDPDYPNASGDRQTNAKSAADAYYNNPYDVLNGYSYDQTTSFQLFTDLLLKQKLDFITEGLSLNGKFSFSTNLSRLSESASRDRMSWYLDWNVYDIGEGNPWIPNTGGTSVIEEAPISVSQGSINSFDYNLYWEGSVNYNRSWRDHHVTALALFNQRERATGSNFKYRNEGLVGRLTYDYAHKYLFEANAGYTGSEQFAPSNRFGFFPSVALGYTLSREEFWRRALPWWTTFKLRYSDGLVGNDSTSSRWLYYGSYSSSGKMIKEDAAANVSARWETAHKRDLGVEMGWFRDRLSLVVDLFDEYRTNMLIAPNVTLLVGTSYKEVNRGEIKKHGLETEVQWKDKIRDFHYHAQGMFSINENRILNYEDPPYAPDYQKMAGKAYGSQTNGVSLVDGGYYTSVDDIHTYPSYSTDWLKVPVGGYKYLDYSADGVINSEDLYAVPGSLYPAVVYSFGGGFEYKGWKFSFLFYGNAAKCVNFNGSFELDFNKGDKRLSKSMSDYWTPTNLDAGHATMVPSSGTGHLMYSWAGYNNNGTAVMALRGRTWRKADYLTLRDVYLGYTFPLKGILGRLGVRSLSLFANGNNLYYVTDLIEGNPEAKNFTTGFYPLMAHVQLGVKVGF